MLTHQFIKLFKKNLWYLPPKSYLQPLTPLVKVYTHKYSLKRDFFNKKNNNNNSIIGDEEFKF